MGFYSHSHYHSQSDSFKGVYNKILTCPLSLDKNSFNISKRYYSSTRKNREEKMNKEKFVEKLMKIAIKVAIIFVIGYIIRWYINDIFDVNVFVQYNHWLSITYYLSMAGLTAFIHELFNHLDGSKMYMDGVDSDYGIKDNKGKV